MTFRVFINQIKFNFRELKYLEIFKKGYWKKDIGK